MAEIIFTFLSRHSRVQCFETLKRGVIAWNPPNAAARFPNARNVYDRIFVCLLLLFFFERCRSGEVERISFRFHGENACVLVARWFRECMQIGANGARTFVSKVLLRLPFRFIGFLLFFSLQPRLEFRYRINELELCILLFLVEVTTSIPNCPIIGQTMITSNKSVVCEHISSPKS